MLHASILQNPSPKITETLSKLIEEMLLALLRWLLLLGVTMLANRIGPVEIEGPLVVARSRRGEVERPLEDG